MNMRLLLGLIFGAILVGGAQAQQRPGRVALVIGNAAYPDASIPLSTTIRDARTITEELRRDEFFGSFILDDPEMLGVDRLDDSAVVLRFFIKTMPLKQWKVKRELLRRIKRTFDELKIEIPYPHRTVFHRYEDGTAGAQMSADRKAA